MQVWRAALYLSEGGYITQPSLKSKVVDSVEAAIKLGLYVIIDWHVHLDRDPRMYQQYAIEFFGEMARYYGSYPNVLYEICNEPNGRAKAAGRMSSFLHRGNLSEKYSETN